MIAGQGEGARGLVDGCSLASLGRRVWDLVVVGGGITGAGVFREAARSGLRVLLVEKGDFASGTSSRSSKLVHGGLHYLARMDVAMALEAIRERDRLIRMHPGLVRSIDVLLPVLPGAGRADGLRIRTLLGAYGMLAEDVKHPEGRSGRTVRNRWIGAWPRGVPPGDPAVRAVFRYSDGQTDDAGLVLRVLGQGVEAGGVARNYTEVVTLIRDADGFVRGVRVRDVESGACSEIVARVTVNAAGPWSDDLRQPHACSSRLRLVRGSHLVFPWYRLPLRTAVAHIRPSDGGAVIMVPWKGVTLVGGTVVEHQGSPGCAVISAAEALTLLDDVRRVFPDSCLGPDDIQATFSACRPIVDRAHGTPATASRRDECWEENGLITVAGGKLTTFRAMARKALELARPRLPGFRFQEPPPECPGPLSIQRRLEARYGAAGARAIVASRDQSLLAAELAWCARNEGVRHLDDLLLRRTRVGFVMPRGGRDLLPTLASTLLEALGWDQVKWTRELHRYADHWNRTMGIPHGIGHGSRSPWRPGETASIVDTRWARLGRTSPREDWFSLDPG